MNRAQTVDNKIQNLCFKIKLLYQKFLAKKVGESIEKLSFWVEV